MFGIKKGILGRKESIFIGILDLFPNSNRAYSLRRLSNNYTGALIRVRRDIDGIEQDIGYNTNNDLDIVDLISFVGVGNGYISTWYDQSGNGVDGVQTIELRQYKIVTNGSVNLRNGKATGIAISTTNDVFTIPISGLSPTCTVSAVEMFNSGGFIIPVEGDGVGSKYYAAAQSGSSSTAINASCGTPSHYVNNVSLSGNNRGQNYLLMNNVHYNLFTELVDFSGWTQYELNFSSGTGSCQTELQERIIWNDDYSGSRIDIQNNVNDYFLIYP